MEPGRASQTAVMVCSGRAIAHGRGDIPRFSDPTALPLLPEAVRGDVMRFLEGERPRGIRGHLRHAYAERQARVMAARTIAIDDAIREAAAPQVVILGAGLDGRAWRMAELADSVVFEVDHPDSQRDKQARVPALSRIAREVRFVPMDFTRDSLDAALADAGHAPDRPTTWIWEGVVMYLTKDEIEQTLAVIDRRSGRSSRLVVAYHAPSPVLFVVGFVVRRIGEPLRSSQTPAEMRALLARYGFDVVRDDHIRAIADPISHELARDVRSMTHMRIAIADRQERADRPAKTSSSADSSTGFTR